MLETRIRKINSRVLEHVDGCPWKTSNIPVDDPTQCAIEEAASILRSGELVSFPTETVYGLGANGLNKNAALKIYNAKGRPSDNPLILHISSLDMLSMILPSGKKLPAVYEPIVSVFWPGPLTIIVPRGENVPLEVTGGLDTVGVRFPSNTAALALISACGFPLAAPSANSSGLPSTTQAKHVFDDLNGKIPLILDGGPCEYGVESTVIDAITSPTPTILRPGGVTLEDIVAIKGFEKTRVGAFEVESESSVPTAPGMKYRHYSPNARIILFLSPDNKSTSSSADLVADAIKIELDRTTCSNPKCTYAILTFHKETLNLVKPKISKSIRAISLAEENNDQVGVNLRIAARNLFSLVREIDSTGVDFIFIEAPPALREGLSVVNRLKKAAFRIVEL